MAKRDIMSEMVKFYRVTVTGEAGAFRGVITHKASGKSMVVNVPCATDSAAVLVARAHLTAAVKRGALPLA